MKIAVVTCYKHNDYIRARTLRSAFAADSGVKTLVVRNRYTGLLRYPETALRLLRVRLLDRPDAYVITFRGYEVLLLMRLTLVRKPIIFDELVNFTEWMEEHGRLIQGRPAYRVFRRWNAWLVRRCRFILADTDAHAAYSAKLNMLSMDRYKVIPVCADEALFQPKAEKKTPGTFTVLYYGTMLPLHGVEYVLEAARLLQGRSDIRFRFVGGKRRSDIGRACAAATAEGAQVTHESWIPFEELPAAIRKADIVLGGPFGETLQSEFVVTGKTYQALACAAPVLIGQNKVNEGFTDEKNCLMVPRADSGALAEAISWAADHPKELAAIGRAGRRLYEQNFSQRHVNQLAREIIKEASWSWSTRIATSNRQA